VDRPHSAALTTDPPKLRAYPFRRFCTPWRGPASGEIEQRDTVVSTSPPLRSDSGSAVPAWWFAGGPPVRFLLALLAEPLEPQRRSLPPRTARTTEAPQFLRRALVAVDQLVELKWIELARVELVEPVTDVFEQQPQISCCS